MITGTRTMETASRILAERWKLPNDAASAVIADIAEETGVAMADLAALIVASISGVRPDVAISPQLATGARSGAAETPSDIEAAWDDFMADLERNVLGLGAGGWSLGLMNGSRVHTFNRGFSERTSAVYATISAQADLPGPATVRSGQAQYFDSHEDAGARYPKSVGIYAGTQFSAAACLPLVMEGERVAFGYLAVHYQGTRHFGHRLQGELGLTAEATTRAIHKLVSDTRPDHHAGDQNQDAEQLRTELFNLRKAMETRAEIEQAKGMLMQRFALDADQSWDLMCRISSVTNVKVRTMAHALVTRREVAGLPSASQNQRV